MVTINVTVRNAGTAPSNKVNVLILYDTNQLISQGNISMAILPGEMAFCETVWDTSKGNLMPGSHKVNVTVQELLSGDDNPANNTAIVDFEIVPVPAPHVFVDEITLPNSAMVDDNVTVTAKVKNNGNKDQTDDDSVVFLLGSVPLGTVRYDTPLPADNVTSSTVNFKAKFSQAGTYWITVQVVSSQLKTDSHTINITQRTPNVYIVRVDIDRSDIMQGESVTVKAILRNNGTGNALNEEIWFLEDQATSPSSTNYTTYKDIYKGDSDVQVSFLWNSTDADPGNHTFTVRAPNSADPNAARTSGVLRIRPRLPKMALTGFEVLPDTVNSGEPVILSAVLENTGTGDAYNQEVRFFLGSVENYPLALKKVNVRAGSSASANFTYIPEIGENSTRMNFFVRFADTVMNDSVWVNTTVPLYPDLTVVSADFPASMTKGLEYLVTAVIANNGKTGASNFTVKFNLGAEKPGLVGNLELAEGQTLTVNCTFTPSIAGSGLKLKVDADCNHTVQESNEFNNIYESPILITVFAESQAFIELQSVNAAQKSYSVKTGDKATVKVTLTLQNKGEKAGRVLLVIREGPAVVVSENVSVPANQNTTVTYKWNITGAKTHTAKVEIQGADAGLVTSRVISVELSETAPGFELVLVAAAVAAVALLVRRRRK